MNRKFELLGFWQFHACRMGKIGEYVKVTTGRPIDNEDFEVRIITTTELDYSWKRNTAFLLYTQLTNRGE